MTKTEERKIEKAMIEKISNEEVGTETHKRALSELLDFQKQQEEIRKNQESERLAIEKLQEEVRKNQEAESLDKKRFENETNKAQQDNMRALANEELEREKLKIQKKAERLSRLNNVLCSILSIFGGIATTVIGYKLFDKQAEKAYKYEETGTISSFTSKQVLSGLKPPKK